MKQQHVIVLTPAEIHSGSDRVKWAEGLILQLPETHEGRNSWLVNYGKSDAAIVLRNRWELENSSKLDWNEETESANFIVNVKSEKILSPLDAAIDEILPMFEGMEPMAKARTADEFATFCHSQLSGGIGMKIRNHFGLWDNTKPLTKFFIDTFEHIHPDSMSAMILVGVHKRLISK